MPAAPRAPVVVGIGADTSCEGALAWGADEADRLSLPLRVIVALGHPARRSPPASPRPRAGRRAQDPPEVPVGQALAFVKTRLPHLEVSARLAPDDLAPVLGEQARTAATLVFDSRRANRRTALFTGSTVRFSVFAHAKCPVVVLPVPEGDRGRPYFVVGADLDRDGRRHSAAALHHAFERAARQDAELRVLHVWHPPVLGVLDERAALRECRRMLADTVAGLQTLHPAVHVRHAVLRGPVAEVLTEESARSLGLIVGIRRRGGASRLPAGSVVIRALPRARCPVIAVPRTGTYAHPEGRSRVSRPAHPGRCGRHLDRLRRLSHVVRPSRLRRLGRRAVRRRVRLLARVARLLPSRPR
ncbi:universal stress protein [Streptomyces sp. Je 1-369]|uniref:universal stress protein n=1 Tax=Streptomyces sp. Je 1-369 TaxID=2966192 RepID=UPI002285981D|nr:universal stress protein [Streptomyces sp. Je 1-369]WAL99647.1 universal stress protein [Streptomyces sp. Je 1-369]